VILARWPTLVLAAATAAAVAIVPRDELLRLSGAPVSGVLAFLATVAFLALERLRGRRGSRLERIWLILFLVGMPLVYLRALAARGGEPADWAIEQAGLAIFAILAALAVTRSWRWLVWGVALHGFWDLGHLVFPAAVPPWYALACFLIDGALAVWLAGEVDAWPRGLAPRAAAEAS